MMMHSDPHDETLKTGPNPIDMVRRRIHIPDTFYFIFPLLAIILLNVLFSSWLIYNDSFFQWHETIVANLVLSLAMIILFAAILVVAVRFRSTPSNRKSNWEKITVIIPVYNEEKHIYHVLEKVGESDYPKDKFSIIVINDGSRDNSLSEIRRFEKDFSGQIEVINFEKNRGKKSGLVAGFQAATGEIIVTLDSDTFIKSDSIRYLIRHFDEDTAAVCGYTDVHNARLNWLTRIQQYEYFISHQLFKAFEARYSGVMCCPGCFSAYRKEAVMEVLDMFEEARVFRFHVDYGEDRFLTALLLRKRYSIKYAGEARAWTIVPSTLKSFIIQRKRWIKSWFVNSLYLIKIINEKPPPYFIYFYLSLLFNILIISIPPLIVYLILTGQPQYILHSTYIIVLYLLFSGWKEKKIRIVMPVVFYFFTLLIYSWLVPLAISNVKDERWGRRAH